LSVALLDLRDASVRGLVPPCMSGMSLTILSGT
jgi:hypothetical protein